MPFLEDLRFLTQIMRIQVNGQLRSGYEKLR